MKWERHTPTEEFFREHDIPYRFVEDFLFHKINIEESLRNQARVDGPLNEDDVERYAEGMVRGDTFPAIAVHKKGRSYIVVNGNRRCAAFQHADLDVEGATIAAYVLDTDDPMLIDLATCGGLNAKNGRALSVDDKIEQAIRMLDKYPNIPKSKIAKVFGASINPLSKAIIARGIAEGLKERRIPADKLSRSALVEIGKLRNEPAMAVAADIAIRGSLPFGEVKELISAAKPKRSEAKQIAALQEFEEEKQQFAPKSIERKSTVKAQFLGTVHKLQTLVAKYPTLAHLHLTAASDIAAAHRDCESLRKAIRGLFAK